MSDFVPPGTLLDDVVPHFLLLGELFSRFAWQQSFHGLGWRGKHSSLEAAYGLDFYNERNITHDQNNPAFNGKYTFNVHLISLAYNYSF